MLCPSFRIVTALLFILVALGCGGGSGKKKKDSGSSSSPPRLSIASASVTEGDVRTLDLTFAVELSRATDEDVTVDFETADGTATLADFDYRSIPTTTLTIPAGDRDASITVTIENDDRVELDETFELRLSNVSSNARLDDDAAQGTIVNDDFPVVDIAAVEIDEGDSGSSTLVFPVTLDVAAIGDVTVLFDTSNITALAGSDYTALSDTLTIPEGSLLGEIEIEVFGDTLAEADETLVVALSDLSLNARMGTNSAFGTIRNDDANQLSIRASSVEEGDSGARSLSFDVLLNGPAADDITLSYQTVNSGSATAGIDYEPIVGGEATILAGDSATSVSVTTYGDTDDEANETFVIELTGLTGTAELHPTASSAIGTIRDDDGVVDERPQVSVSSALVTEGNAGEIRELEFQITIAPVSSSFPIFMSYTTEPVAGGATPGVDYVETASSFFSIPAGTASTTIRVPVNGDDDIEADEAVNLSMQVLVSTTANLTTPIVTGLIIDDDDTTATGPRLNITHASQVEGNSGTPAITFLVSLTEEASSEVRVLAQTADFAVTPEALAGSDYSATAQTLIIAQGERTVDFVVPILPDAITEGDERFEVTLSGITGDASLGNSIAFGTILTDEAFSFVSISNEAIREGDDPNTTDLEFRVTLDAEAGDDITFDYATIAGDAEADVDFVAVPTTQGVVPAGSLETTLIVTLLGDDDREIDERFSLELSNLSQNAEFDRAVGTGTIVNDDNGLGWGDPEPLNPLGVLGESALPKLAMNDAGEAMVAWFSPQSTILVDATNPTARFTPGAGWGDVQEPPGQVPSTSIYFALTIDGLGESTLVRSTGGLISERHIPGQGWVELTDQDDDVSAAYPDIGTSWDLPALASNEAGDAIMTARSTQFGVIRRNTVFNTYSPASGWETTDLVAPLNDAYPDSNHAIDEEGRGLLVAGGESTARHYDPSTGVWSDSVPLTDPAGSGFHEPMTHPVVAMNADGDAIVVWQGPSLDIMANRYDETSDTWAGPELIFEVNGSVDDENPRAVIDDDGNAFVIFMREDPDAPQEGYSIYSRRFDAASGEWEAEIDTVATPSIAHRRIFSGSGAIFLQNGVDVPALAMDGAGVPFVIWLQDIEGLGVHVVRASRHDGTRWGPPDIVSDELEGDASVVRIAADGLGNAIAVWQQLDPTTGFLEVRANRFEP